MLRVFFAFVVLVVLAGAGLAVAAWPRPSEGGEGFATTEQLVVAYERVHDGTPMSRLAELGFDPARAKHLSSLGLVEHFMPKDSVGFDALDPALQACFEGRTDCGAYIYPVAESEAQAVLLIEGGKVAWKTVTGLSVIDARRTPRVARR